MWMKLGHEHQGIIPAGGCRVIFAIWTAAVIPMNAFDGGSGAT
jgi:hypothetical protein